MSFVFFRYLIPLAINPSPQPLGLLPTSRQWGNKLAIGRVHWVSFDNFRAFLNESHLLNGECTVRKLYLSNICFKFSLSMNGFLMVSTSQKSDTHGKHKMTKYNEHWILDDFESVLIHAFDWKRPLFLAMSWK